MKKQTTKKEKKNKENFLVGVRSELALVSWPTFKNVFKYTCATLIFMLFVTGFFLLINLIMSVVKGWAL